MELSLPRGLDHPITSTSVHLQRPWNALHDGVCVLTASLLSDEPVHLSLADGMHRISGRKHLVQKPFVSKSQPSFLFL